MKKNIFSRITLVVATSALMLSSCDYLDILPPEQATSEDTMETRDRMFNFLSSCYHAVLKQNPIAHDCFYQSTDEFIIPPLFNNEAQITAWNQMNGNKVPVIWENTYSYIGQCHRFLQQIEKLETQGKLPINATEEDVRICKDEVAFVKAYYHYRLLEAFGPIPMMEEMPSQNITAEDIPGRNHYDYCVDYLVKLFDEAVNNLPAVRQGPEWGRATAAAAKAIKSRMLVTAASDLWNGRFPFPEWKNKELTGNQTHDDVYGYDLVSQKYDRSKWERALEASLDALQYAENEGERKLWKVEDALEDFRSFPQFEAENNSEIKYPERLMWNGLETGDLTKVYVPFVTDVVKRYVDSDESNDPTANEFAEAVDHLVHVVCMRMLPHRFENDGYKEIIWGYYQSSTDNRWMTRRNALFPTRIIKKTNGTWQHGWATWAPTLYTVEHFYTKDGLLPEDDSTFPQDDANKFSRAGITEQHREDIIKLVCNREPRFYAWIGFDGGDFAPIMDEGKRPVILDMNSSDNDASDGVPGQGYSNEYNRDYSATGFLTTKWCKINQINSALTGDDNGSNYENYPMPIIRLAELYLNVAECYAELDKPEEAMPYLNVIRKRAGVPELTVSEIEAAGKTVLDYVRAERFIEFYGEAIRYNDVRRWMIAPEQLAANKREGLYVDEGIFDPTFEEFNRRTPVRQSFQWEDRMYMLPIANSEVYASKKLVQAPNY